MKHFSSIVLLLLVQLTWAQPIQFDSSLDTNRIEIGEPLQLTLSARVPRGTQFFWPSLPDTISDIEILESAAVDTLLDGDQWKLTQRLSITVFDSGYFAIPPLSLSAEDGSARSSALPFAVELPAVEGDEFSDIYDPLDAEFNWLLIGAIAVALILLGVGIFYLIRYLRARKTPDTPSYPELKVSPFEQAKKQLAELKEERLAEKGRVKEYYSRLTDILREYLEREMNIRAMESTPTEVAAQVRQLQLAPDLKEKVEELMGRTVMIKYARETPGQAYHEASMAIVHDFIERSHRMEEKSEPESQPS